MLPPSASNIPKVIMMKDCLPQRKHARLKQYDYSAPGAYYITICTQNRCCLFSQIVERGLAPAEIQLFEYGRIAQEQLLLLEKRYSNLRICQYVIMPNHIHAIIMLENAANDAPSPSITDIICAYKSLVTKKGKAY